MKETPKKKFVEYRNGDLFSAAALNTILVHACNCQGVWGSGIAVGFKQRYPNAHKAYKGACDREGDGLIGSSTVFTPHIWEPCQQKVGFLYTSVDFGDRKDKPAKILRNTQKAIDALLENVNPIYEIHSPKINSGKFAVPWKETEAVLEDCLSVAALKGRTFKWLVWDNAPRH